MERSLQYFGEAIIDYAGLFPPAKLDLPVAFENYQEYMHSADSWMLGRFVCPVTKLAELGKLLPEGGGSRIFTVSALGRGGNSYEEFLKNLSEDLKLIALFQDDYHHEVRIEILETRIPELDDEKRSFVAAIQQELDKHTHLRPIPSFEVSLPEENWKESIEDAIDAVNYMNLHHRTSHRPASLKLRCGGLEAEQFPSIEQVSFFICSCRDHKLPFKCTAGLHHPIRHFDDTVQAPMHGFINLFGSALLANHHHLSQAQVSDILSDEQVDNFGFTPDGFYWRNLSIPVDSIHELRRGHALSFGSCSFTEPLHDLRSLGWIR
ncbi:MAG: hypothetical protein CMO81_01585 [Waddliaceae bacterium]|nr:hypothetical protein [Waddliaceae bacterium]